jgi:hypothetical protein
MLASALLATACTDRALGPEDPSQPGQPSPSQLGQPSPSQPGQPSPSQPGQPSSGDSVHGIRFYPDIQADLDRLTCTVAGGCHGGTQSPRWLASPTSLAAIGANYEAFRGATNPVEPWMSLVLLKALGKEPHVGGVLMAPDDPAYQRWIDWISGPEPE